MSSRASEKLANIATIRRLLGDLERWWKTSTLSDQATIEDNKDENLRILNLIETELERAGLWDRAIDMDEKTLDGDQNPLTQNTTTLEQISEKAKAAKNWLTQHKK